MSQNKMANQYTFASLEERFWSKVDLDGPVLRSELGPCYVWTAARNSWGYGTFAIGGRPVLAHRAAWFLETGAWPDPFALHHCDDPPCVRFEHLYEGGDAENNRDMVARGRSPVMVGELNSNARLTADLVEEIRSRYAQGGVLQRELADLYGMSFVQINKIIRRVAWS